MNGYNTLKYTKDNTHTQREAPKHACTHAYRWEMHLDIHLVVTDVDVIPLLHSRKSCTVKLTLNCNIKLCKKIHF